MAPEALTSGMNQKALTGGTNGKAPIGYLNVRKRDELGREMRVVEPDPDRAALVKWAFEAYATGNYPNITLHEELIDTHRESAAAIRALLHPEPPGGCGCHQSAAPWRALLIALMLVRRRS